MTEDIRVYAVAIYRKKDEHLINGLKRCGVCVKSYRGSSTAIDANFLNIGALEAETLTSVILMNNLGNMVGKFTGELDPALIREKIIRYAACEDQNSVWFETFYSNNDKSAFEEILTKHYQCKVVRNDLNRNEGKIRAQAVGVTGAGSFIYCPHGMLHLKCDTPNLEAALKGCATYLTNENGFLAQISTGDINDLRLSTVLRAIGKINDRRIISHQLKVTFGTPSARGYSPDIKLVKKS